MPLLFFHQWTVDPLAKALCWTFVHSLWQGMLVAIIGGGVILMTKKTKASLRYNLLLLLFGLYTVLVTATFVQELKYNYSAKENPVETTVNMPNVTMIPFSGALPFVDLQDDGFIDQIAAYLNENSTYIVLFWVVLFLAKCFKLGSGLFYINRLRSSGKPAPEQWRELSQRLAQQIGLQQPIVLLESSLVNVPVAIGYLKAAIIVPLGLLSKLPFDQVEAVLLHELAHIRRRDYLVNIVQSFVEAVFFFNPGILWISSLIRREREACCDDVVLLHTDQKKTYLEALVSFQEYSLTHAGQLIALTHKKNHLLHRVQRMLTQENQKLNSMEKTVLMLGILGITAFGFIPEKQISSPLPVLQQPSTLLLIKPKETVRATSATPSKGEKKVAHPVRVIPVQDTVPNTKKEVRQSDFFTDMVTNSHDDGQTKTQEVHLTDKEGKKYQIKKVNGQITEFTVDGKKVDPTDKQYSELLGQIERKDALRTEQSKQRAEQRKLAAQARVAEQQQRREKAVKAQEERLKLQNERRLDQEKRASDQKMKYEEQRKKQKEFSYKIDTTQQRNSKKLLALSSAKKNYVADGEVGSIIADLKKRDLINDDNVFSFTLSNKELIVNGTKQPEDLHQSLKEKYLRKEGDAFIYSKQGNSTSTVINKE